MLKAMFKRFRVGSLVLAAATAVLPATAMAQDFGRDHRNVRVERYDRRDQREVKVRRSPERRVITYGYVRAYNVPCK